MSGAIFYQLEMACRMFNAYANLSGLVRSFYSATTLNKQNKWKQKTYRQRLSEINATFAFSRQQTFSNFFCGCRKLTPIEDFCQQLVWLLFQVFTANYRRICKHMSLVHALQRKTNLKNWKTWFFEALNVFLITGMNSLTD